MSCYLIFSLLISLTISFPLRNLDKSEGIISINFYVATKNELLLSPIEIGTPAQQMNLILDIGSERTWISEEVFNKTSSSSFQTNGYTDKKQQDSFSYRGIWSTDNVQLSDKKLKSFDFLLVDKIESNDLFKGVISLGREYDTKQFSLVYRMSASSATFYNSFVLRFSDIGNKGELYIGDLTSELKDYKNLISSCKLINKPPRIKWGCMLSHVFIGEYGDKTFTNSYTQEQGFIISGKNKLIQNIDKPAFFESIYNKIYVPKEFMIFLKNDVFINKSKGIELCNYNDEISRISFTCSKEEVNQIPKINLVFSEKLALTLPIEKLFDCKGDTCEYLIEYNEQHSSNWIMGLPLLKTYQMIFDYNKEDLLFYSKDNKAYVQMPNNNGTSVARFFFYLIVFVGLALVIGVGFIYFLRRKNKRRKLIEEQIYENF